jgi:hypothetical protein
MEIKQLFRKGFSVATIGIFLVSIFAVFNPAAAVVPAPASYQLEEYAWLKEDGLTADTWKQYNNTGWNRLNLSFKFSKCNIAYVARSAATADDFNVTFIVYRNISASNGFFPNGTLYAGSAPVKNWTVPAVSTQTAGLYTYHLFITTFDPEGTNGLYQVRINETGPGSGSSWTTPNGNPNVQWMFFFVPTATPLVRVTDQLGRPSPYSSPPSFFLDGDSPTTQYNATMVITPPGNSTGATKAQFQWLDTDGSTVLWAEEAPIYYAPGEGWATQWVVNANTSFTPFNASYPYWVRVTMGAFTGAERFYSLSTQWIEVSIDVSPTKGQWFDPSSFLATFTAVINTGIVDNPYQDVYNLTLQFWDKVHKDLLPTSKPDGVPEWYGGSPSDPAGNPVFANLSWNITGYDAGGVIPGSSYTYTYTKMIPASYIDNSTNRLSEYFGWYAVKSKDGAGIFPAVSASKEFYVDDGIEGYFSREKASTTVVPVWEQKPATAWANVEFDPIYLRSGRQHDSAEFKDKKVNITWYWTDYLDTSYIKPPGNDHQTMTQAAEWPSDEYWAFSTASINSSFVITTYDVVVNATCDTDYVIRERMPLVIVYRALYLEIWPLEDEYMPCMKKSIEGKTYYLDENNNEVPVEWGFYISMIVDPEGVPYFEGTEVWGEGCGWAFPSTITMLSPDETESLGAIWDELPSDARLGTWTVYAMALYADWDEDDVQDIGGYSFQGPVTTTFEVVGEDVHYMIDDIIDEMDENFNATWEVLADILANQELTQDELGEMMVKLGEVYDTIMDMDTDMMAKLDSIEDYVREIRALSQRIDRWRTDIAEDLADQFQEVLFDVQEVNDNINGKWTELGDLWQVTFYGVNDRDPRSMSYKINQVRVAVVDAVVNSLNQMVSKMDTVEASLGDKLINVLNAVTSEVGGLDDSMKAYIAANVAYVVDNLRGKMDDVEAGLSGKIASAADGLHGKFAGVINEIGYVSNKVDKVEEKLGGVESNVGDKVDAVDASVGTKLLVAIILIVIVLILVLLPIVAPGFRMKE